MLTSRILSNKKVLSDKGGLTDLIYTTFRFPGATMGQGMVVVQKEEQMRPDLIAERTLGDQTKWDALLKFNGISNPFSVQKDRLLYMIPFGELDKLYKKPRDIPARGEKSESDASPILDPKTNKDKQRLNNLKDKKVLPPNVNSEGDTNVKIKDGKLIFGEDVTTANKDNCPVPISRSRLQAALLKDKLFI
jgi:hypothetical protein